MSEKSDVTTGQSTQVQEAGESGYVLRPPVNVFEDAEGITLEADMPGVSKDQLTLKVDRDSLLVEGDIHFDMPEGTEALHAPRARSRSPGRARWTRSSRSSGSARPLPQDGSDSSSLETLPNPLEHGLAGDGVDLAGA